MISVAEAQALVHKHVTRGKIEVVHLKDALGFVLAQEITSRFPTPRFDNTAVDGYAVSLKSFADVALPLVLPVTHEVQAGDRVTRKLKTGETWRIFTGAQLPIGTDAVVMQEDVERVGMNATFSSIPKQGANIRKRGTEFSKGTTILKQGTIISPPVISTLATLGYDRVKVYAKPRLSIIITGNELKAPGESLGPGEIFDANSFALVAALKVLGLENVRVLHVRDTLQSTTIAFRKALASSDFVIATGGVSVGDHDHVKEALASLGVEEIFWRIRMKPGKPLYFGKRREGRKSSKFVFGLPGNPVSVMVGFALFIRPVLLQCMGREGRNPWITATLMNSISKPAGRAEYVRGMMKVSEEGHVEVKPLDARESYMTSSMAIANCLLEFPTDDLQLETGALVRVLPLEWSLM